MESKTGHISPAGKSYRFLTGPDSPEFCQKVSDALADGWVLYGSPVLAAHDGVLYAGQAVIRPQILPAGQGAEKNK